MQYFKNMVSPASVVLLMAFGWTVIHGDLICTSDADCGPDQCCVIDYGIRYGGTKCQSMGQEDASCRPYDLPINTTLTLGASCPEVPVRGVHHGLCPCRPGLRCSSGTCQYSLPQGSESHTPQVPQGQGQRRLPPGSESHPAQVPR